MSMASRCPWSTVQFECRYMPHVACTRRACIVRYTVIGCYPFHGDHPSLCAGTMIIPGHTTPALGVPSLARCNVLPAQAPYTTGNNQKRWARPVWGASPSQRPDLARASKYWLGRHQTTNDRDTVLESPPPPHNYIYQFDSVVSFFGTVWKARGSLSCHVIAFPESTLLAIEYRTSLHLGRSPSETRTLLVQVSNSLWYICIECAYSSMLVVMSLDL